MSFSLFLKLLRRESRGQRGKLLFFVLCLAVGVCAIVAIQSFVDAVRDGVSANSRALMGADLVVEGRRTLPPELADRVRSIEGAKKTDVIELPTMIVTENAGSRLSELIVIEGAYPLYGEFITEPERPLGEILDAGEVVLEADAARELKLGTGDTIAIGGESYVVGAIARKAPEKSGFSFMLGPRIFIGRKAFDRTDLLGFGSRVKYRALVKLDAASDPGEAKRLAEDWSKSLPGSAWLTVRSHDRVQPALDRSFDQVERYLGLVALLSLVLGGIGVARIVRVWIEARTQNVAIMRCLGLTPPQVAAVYLGQVGVLALLGSTVGAVAGSSLPWLVSRSLPEIFPPELLVFWQPMAILKGIGLGMIVAALFSVPPLTALWRVSPARVFRAGADPLRAPRGLLIASGVIVLAGLTLAAWRQARDWRIALGFVAFVIATTAILAFASWLLRLALRRLPRQGMHPYLRHGFAALVRPGTGITGTIVALGLGALVVSSILLIESRLRQGIERALPEDAPTVFFVDVQPDQWESLSDELGEAGGRYVDSTPVVLARLESIDGRPVEEIAEERKSSGRNRRGWVLRREQRLTWTSDFNESNEIVDGLPFADDARPEISIEEKFARDLDVGVGSRVTFDIQGLSMEFVVSSLRKVEWASFGINFFLVAEPGYLDDAPYYRIATGRFEESDEVGLQDRLAERFPNVTMIRLRSIIARVTEILRAILLGIGLLGSFTVIAGLGILAGSVGASSLQRVKEAALLKVLGVTPRGVLGIFFIEFALLGFVAGLVGTLGGVALALIFGANFLELDGSFNWWIAPAVLVVCTLATAITGCLAAGRALRARPRLALAGS